MEDDSAIIEKLLPLRPRDYLILFVLATGAQHGYGIIRRVEEETDGMTRLDPANLYRAVKRLSRQGLLAEAEEIQEPTVAGGERRRFWEITKLGRGVVLAEARRLARLTERARTSGLISESEG